MGPFTARRKQKAWNNTREKYVPEERSQNLAETDWRSHYNQEEWVEEFLDDKGAFYNGSESDDCIMIMMIVMKIWKQSFADILQNRCS